MALKTINYVTVYFFFYYIDAGVLLKNRPLIKFIRNYIRDDSSVFSISLYSEDINDIISRHCTAAKRCQTPVERWRVEWREVKVTEADIKSFSKEQENTNMKKETSRDLKQLKGCTFLARNKGEIFKKFQPPS